MRHNVLVRRRFFDEANKVGFKQTIGYSIRYFIIAKDTQRKLGCLMFSSASAYSSECRDKWIG